MSASHANTFPKLHEQLRADVVVGLKDQLQLLVAALLDDSVQRMERSKHSNVGHAPILASAGRLTQASVERTIHRPAALATRCHHGRSE